MVSIRNRLFLLAATLWLAAVGVFLQTSAQASTLDRLPGAPGYVHEVFGVTDGLPSAGITKVLQSRDGYLWLATFDGLLRFDGHRFEVFDSDRVPALGSNRVVEMVEGRDGVLWTRTEQGQVARYSKGVFTSCSRPQQGRVSCGSPQPGAPYYTRIDQDAAGTVWLGGPASVFRVSAAGAKDAQEIPGRGLEGGVQAILLDHAGRLWVGTGLGVWMRRAGRFERVEMPAGAFELIYPSIAEDSAGDVWVATSRGAGRVRDGVLTLETQGWGFLDRDSPGGIWIAAEGRLSRWRGGPRGGRIETVVDGQPGNHRLLPGSNVRIDPRGQVWTAWTGSLYRDGVPVLRLPNPLDVVTSVTLDREGTVWATTSRSGELHALHPARLAAFTEGLPDPPVVYPLYEDRDGTILAGGRKFLASLAPGARRFRLREIPGERVLEATAMLRDRAGVLWVGTTPGLFHLDEGPGVGGFVPTENGALQRLTIRALHEDARGALWAGTEGGLFRREPVSPGGRTGRWTRTLPRQWVRVIRETPDGALWLGTNGGGLIRFAEGRFTAVTQAEGLSSDIVRALWLAPDGRLWIGTENRGLSRLDPGSVGRAGGPRIARIGQGQGLYSNGIHQIVADGLGNLWMSSNQGIFRARLADLNAVADGRKERLETFAYTERDGMAAREANGSVQDAGLRDRAGRLWFPTQAGVVRVDPREVLRRREPPPVHVEGLRVGEVETPLAGGDVRLSPSQRSFTFELAAPSFLAPERQEFRYRLVPYDHDWIDAGTRREASYTKVPPGKYRFEALASGPDGEWSPRPAVVEVEVVPRFFETRWFLLVAFLASAALAAGLVVVLVRLREARQRTRQGQLERLVEERTATIGEQAEKLRELDQLKSQFFANVSHELRTPLTLTLGPLRDALEGRFGPLRDDLAGQLGVAERNAQRLLGLVDQLLDTARLDAGRLRLRARQGDLAAFIRQRVEAFLPLAQRREIELSLASAEPVEVWFDEVQLEKVFDNLISNALKFTSRGGRVQVAVAAPPWSPWVTVSVRDNGPGIPADQLGQVFERFYQVEATSRRRWPGAGIGLALARQLVELHRGSISAESPEGEGACFTVALRRGTDHFPPGLVEEGPASRERPSSTFLATALLDERGTPTPDADEEPSPEEADRTTVLVVEDNAEIRAYIRRHLEPDYRVVEAADGIQGLAQARRLVPDLVVSDVMMPGLDGNALFRSLREDPELEFVPVVLLTAKASAENRLQGLREGVDDYLVKPFDPRELKARVDNLIASRKRLLARFEGAPPRPLRATEVQVTSADESFLARVQATVEERLGDSELTVESLAEALACDRSYLLRRLRALTGETPSGLIRSLRLQRAEQLLKAGAGTVSEIAYSVGFKSVAHFSNAFHETYGERPSTFAARHRGG
jgi:signal transduction histidine kinase/ligand-binding sensor domain-containing protein/DNA-binding response OmpR family regulator